MSKGVDDIVTKLTGKGDPRKTLIGKPAQPAQTETAATEENPKTEQTPTGEILPDVGNLELESEHKKLPNKLKGIYIDLDVLAVYELEQPEQKRGWGSELVSKLLRRYFEANGLFEKHQDVLEEKIQTLNKGKK